MSFSFAYLTLDISAYLSSLDLYPMAITTVAVNHSASSQSISLYFSGSNPSIGQASISMLAHTVSKTHSAMYACFWLHPLSCSGVFDAIVPSIMFLYSISFSIFFASSGSLSPSFALSFFIFSIYSSTSFAWRLLLAAKIKRSQAWVICGCHCEFACNSFLVSGFFTWIHLHGCSPKDDGDNLNASNKVSISFWLTFLSVSNCLVA